ncbi:hypothetical protein FRX31_026387 [Thalictrum thalictroides]|uniref:Transmembrane protein n=1 Tax=Thalictrum thalictroides TaxID=46969 RepID=A0A7J6VFY2_THATH|nr:hypothetical protein FRX31_026387 [Thalictrum thalictroides]
MNSGFGNEDSLIERDGNRILADSMPTDNALSFPQWKKLVECKLQNLEYCGNKLDERITEIKMETIMEVHDENFSEVQEKKAHGILTIILLAITVFIGYIIYLFQLAKKCTGYILALMIVGIIGVVAFGGTGIWTMMEVPGNERNIPLLGEVSTETRIKCRFLISIVTVGLFAILYLIFGYVVERDFWAQVRSKLLGSVTIATGGFMSEYSFLSFTC